MDNNIQPDYSAAYAKIYAAADDNVQEGKATPESGTGKYYKQGSPTPTQLSKRANLDKVKSLTNAGKHKQASALYKSTINSSYDPKAGRHRREWEQFKVDLKEKYKQQFDGWVKSLAEEGYDVERWERQELIDTFIKEHGLHGSETSVMEALSEVVSEEEVVEHHQKDAEGKVIEHEESIVEVSPKKYSNWRDDLGLDENRMTAYTAGMSDAQRDAATSKVSKSLVDKMGRRSDAQAFSDRKRKTGLRLSDTGGKKRANTTGRGQPQQYRKSADSDEWSGRFPYGKSEIVQGKGLSLIHI